MSDERVRPDAPRVEESSEVAPRTPAKERPLSAEEAAAVIREATKLQQKQATGELSREEVIAMGKELGVSPEAVEQALAKRQEQAQATKHVQSERREFAEHLTWYAAVMAVLVGIDFMTGTGWWVQWPAMGWGIGIFFHGVSVLQARFAPESARRRTSREQRRAERRAERHAGRR